jgi:hypothetical protein
MAASTYVDVGHEEGLHILGGGLGLAGHVGLDLGQATPDEGLTQRKCSRGERAVAPALQSHARGATSSTPVDNICSRCFGVRISIIMMIIETLHSVADLLLHCLR